MKWDLWLYHEGAAWWLWEDGYDSLADASSALAELMAKNPSGNVAIGAIVQHGKANILGDRTVTRRETKKRTNN